jgi:hypothetical protein
MTCLITQASATFPPILGLVHKNNLFSYSPNTITEAKLSSHQESTK